MSTYHEYYIAYQMPDGRIYPLGPFDYQGRYLPVVSNSASFASDLYEDLYCVKEKDMTKELALGIYGRGIGEDSEEMGMEIERSRLRYLPLSMLPSSDYIREGYFLIEDVERYLNADMGTKAELCRYEIFFDRIPKEVYAERLKNELIFGLPAKEKADPEEEPYDSVHSCRDYMYFAYADYSSKEYEIHCIREAAGIYSEYDLPEGARMVVVHITT